MQEITQSASNKEIKRYEYDPNGNTLAELVEKQMPGEAEIPEVIAGVMGESEAGGSLTLYSYDPLGRLSGMRKSELAETYAYNADGLRVSKKTASDQTNFVWDGSQVIRETNTQKGQNDVYVRGLRLISRGNEQYLFNGRGDVTQLVNGAIGTVLQNYRYDAFGNQMDANPDDTNPFRYNGEYFDKTTGQYYLRARYYAPSNGRFMSEDPARDGNNWYTYCGNNPINRIDPTGLYWVNGIWYDEYWFELDDGTVMQAIYLDAVPYGDVSYFYSNGYHVKGYIAVIVGANGELTEVYIDNSTVTSVILLKKKWRCKCDKRGSVGF